MDEPTHIPSWENINEVYDKLEDVLTDEIQSKDLSFFELEVILLMLKEKIYEQKHMALNAYAASGLVPDKKASDIYR